MARHRIEQPPSADGFPLLIKGLPESGVKRARQQDIVVPIRNRFSYREFAERLEKACIRSRSLGVERGDTVAIIDDLQTRP